MSREASFLQALAENPNDRTTRLVYADWLDDHGDPRAELIRIEEEMRTLPVFSDRYWSLKPRRHELRTSAPADWLQTLRYGTDTSLLFAHGFPEGIRERWRLIREFVEQWHGGRPLGDVGGRADEIQRTEARLGLELPLSLREWVAFAHDVNAGPALPITVFWHSYTMERFGEQNVLSLFRRAEDGSEQLVRLEDLSHVDPPVHQYFWAMEDDRFNLILSTVAPAAPSLTQFMLQFAIDETGARGGTHALYFPDRIDPTPQLREAFPVSCQIGDRHFFERENLLVEVVTNNPATGCHVVFSLAKPTLRETLPSCLLELADLANTPLPAILEFNTDVIPF